MNLLKLLIFIPVSFLIVWHFKLGLNMTPSLPQGLYMVSDTKEVRHGDIVKLCLSEELTQKTNAKFYVGYGTCSNG